MPDQRDTEAATESSMHKVVILLAAMLTKDDESLVEKVKTLEPLGLTNAQMAAATGASESGVRTTLARLHKSRK